MIKSVTLAGDLHLEITGLDTCERRLGGGSQVKVTYLEKVFQNKYDSRLIAEQVLELSFAVGERLRGRAC